MQHKYRGGGPLSTENLDPSHKALITLLMKNKNKNSILNESLETDEKLSDKGTILDENNLIHEEK